MFELFQLRIAVCRQHFTVRVNIHAFAFGLLQQVEQVDDVVTADQDSFALHWRDAHLGWFWRAKIVAMSGIQQLHHFQIHLTDFETGVEQHADVIGFAGQKIHVFVEQAKHFFAFFAQHHGVIAIRGTAFQTVQHQAVQTEYIWIIALDAGFRRLRQQTL